MMARSSHIAAVERAVQIGGRPAPQTLTDRRATRAAGAEPGRDLEFQTSTGIASRTGRTSTRRRVAPAAAGAPIECAATPTVFLPIDRRSTGPAASLHRIPCRRPTLFTLARVDRCAGISLRRQPGSDTTQDCTYRLKTLRMLALRHAQHDGGVDERTVGEGSRKVGGI